jgi:hypothetical protein
VNLLVGGMGLLLASAVGLAAMLVTTVASNSRIGFASSSLHEEKIKAIENTKAKRLSFVSIVFIIVLFTCFKFIDS